MAKLRMIRNVALRTPERGWIVPKLPVRLIEQTSVGDTIGIGARIRIQVPACKRERKARTQRDDAAGLPATQNGTDESVRVSRHWYFPNVVDHGIVGNVESVAPSI